MNQKTYYTIAIIQYQNINKILYASTIYRMMLDFGQKIHAQFTTYLIQDVLNKFSIKII